MKKILCATAIVTCLALGLTACGTSTPVLNQSGSSDKDSTATSKLAQDLQEQLKDVMKELDSSSVGSKTEDSSLESTSSSSSSQESSPSNQTESDAVVLATGDLVKEYCDTFYPKEDPEVFFFDGSEDYEEYQIYYKKGYLMDRLIDLCFFSKESYDEDSIKNLDLDEVYEGITSMDFVDIDWYDMDDYYVVAIVWNDMTNPDNLQQMVDNGHVAIENNDGSQGLNADSYGKLLEENGSIRLDLETLKTKQ